MSYEPWPQDGCTLAEALQRIADAETFKEWAKRPLTQESENTIYASFWSLIRNKQLIAYGRPATLRAKPQLITPDMVPALARHDWARSAIEESRRGGMRFLDVRVFPTVLSPCRVDLLADLTLREALWKYVLQDPEVMALSKGALKLAPEFERVFRGGHCYVHGVYEWPLGEGSCVVGAERPEDCFLREPHPPLVVDAADALSHRFDALLGLLRRGEVVAQAIPVIPGDPWTILRSVWSHRDFYFDARTEDIFEANQECEDPPRDWLKKRWMGVVMRRPNTHAIKHPESREEQWSFRASSETSEGAALTQIESPILAPENTFHVEPSKDDGLRSSSMEPNVRKLTTRQASIAAAIAANWPSGIPAGLSQKVRDGKIMAWQKDNGLTIASSKTICRYLSAQRK